MRSARLPGTVRLAAAAALVACNARTPLPPSLAAFPPPAPPSLAPPEPTAPDEPPAVHASPLMEGFLAPGGTRPAMQTLRFDVDAVPVATWGPAWSGAGFKLERIRDGWKLWVRTTEFAEVIVTASGVYGEKGTSRVGFSAFTGGSFADGDVPRCGPGTSGRRLAVWNGFAPAGWTDDGVDVEMEEGNYELATCSGTPIRSLRGRASALVPGYVYAVRARNDDEGEESESLVVFLPRGVMVSTAADPTMLLNASNTGPFTRLTFPLARGTAGSASLRLSAASLALWAGMRRMRPATSFHDASTAHDDLLLGLDVVWQGSSRLGALSFSAPGSKDRRAYAGLLAAAKKRATAM